MSATIYNNSLVLSTGYILGGGGNTVYPCVMAPSGIDGDADEVGATLDYGWAFDPIKATILMQYSVFATLPAVVLSGIASTALLATSWGPIYDWVNLSTSTTTPSLQSLATTACLYVRSWQIAGPSVNDPTVRVKLWGNKPRLFDTNPVYSTSTVINYDSSGAANAGGWSISSTIYAVTGLQSTDFTSTFPSSVSSVVQPVNVYVGQQSPWYVAERTLAPYGVYIRYNALAGLPASKSTAGKSDNAYSTGKYNWCYLTSTVSSTELDYLYRIGSTSMVVGPTSQWYEDGKVAQVGRCIVTFPSASTLTAGSTILGRSWTFTNPALTNPALYRNVSLFDGQRWDDGAGGTITYYSTVASTWAYRLFDRSGMQQSVFCYAGLIPVYPGASVRRVRWSLTKDGWFTQVGLHGDWRSAQAAANAYAEFGDMGAQSLMAFNSDNSIFPTVDGRSILTGLGGSGNFTPSTGLYQYQVYQMTAQNRAGWDWVKAHPASL
jgi:hypothetical protein